MISKMKYLLLIVFIVLSGNLALGSEDFCKISDSIGNHSMIYSPKRFSGEYTHSLTGKDLIGIDLTNNVKDGIYVVIKKYIRDKADENHTCSLLDFNAKSALFTTSIVFTMWKKDLFSLDGLDDVKESWNERKPIFIYPYVKSDKINAFYQRDVSGNFSTLNFNFLYGSKTFMCQVFDVVSHEAGHAFLDAIQPKYNNIPTIWNGALHESFGDISAIMSSMEVALERYKFQEVSDFIYKSKPLHINGPAIMECIRKPSEYVGISTHEVHDTSNIFTKAFFKSLNIFYSSLTKKDLDNLKITLSLYRKSLLEAVISEESVADGNNDLLINIANSLINNLQKHAKFNNIIKDIILKPFLDDYSGLTQSIIFNEDEMESFMNIPVPHNINEYNYHLVL